MNFCMWPHLEYAPLPVQALLRGGPGEFPTTLQLFIPVPTLWSEISGSSSSSQSACFRCTLTPLFLPVGAINSVFLCISKYHACNLPSCVLFLAHVTGVHILCSDTIQGVVSLRGDPSKHLVRCCNPLIRVLQNSNSQQMTKEHVFY